MLKTALKCVGQVKRGWMCCERGSRIKRNRAVKRGDEWCLKTGWRNGNTNLCPGWGCSDLFVSDLVIMFSVLPMPSVSFRTRRMRRTHSMFGSAGFRNASHVGINVYTLRADYISLLFLCGTQHLLATTGIVVTFLKMCHQFLWHQDSLN